MIGVVVNIKFFLNSIIFKNSFTQFKYRYQKKYFERDYAKHCILTIFRVFFSVTFIFDDVHFWPDLTSQTRESLRLSDRYWYSHISQTGKEFDLVGVNIVGYGWYYDP